MTGKLVSHWAKGTWAEGETRLHWYLLPQSIPNELLQRIQSRFNEPGFDVVPTPWLHCTVASLLPGAAVAEPIAMKEMVQVVADCIGLFAPIRASANLAAQGSAVVWDLEPIDSFKPIFDIVVGASGPFLRTSRTRAYKPHITVAYANSDHDSDEVDHLLGDPSCSLHEVLFDTLFLLDVRQQDSCYQWNAVESFALGRFDH
jgi:hypothetical protein